MTAQIKFDQVDLAPAGVAGYSRTDGTADGKKVTIINAGGGACTCVFWDKPVDDTSAVLVQESPTTWSFSPQSSVYGTYDVVLTETGTNTKDRKAFSIRLPNSGLVIPSFGAVGVKGVNLASSGGDKAAAAVASTFNEAYGGREYLANYPHLRDLILAVEDLAGSPGGATSSTALTVVIWRPSYAGTDPLVKAAFADALIAAKTSPYRALIVMDASLSTTFALPNAVQDIEGRVLLVAPQQIGAFSITVNANSELINGLGVHAEPGTTLDFVAAAAGTNGTVFRQVDETINFLLSGDITTSGAGNRNLYLDASVAGAGVVRRAQLVNRSVALSTNLLKFTGNARVSVWGPRAPAAGPNGIIQVTGTPTLTIEEGGGAGLDPATYASWAGTKTLVPYANSAFIGFTGNAGNWPEGLPTLTGAAVEILAARDFKVGTFVNPLVFDKNKIIEVTTGSGPLVLALAASGHSAQAVTDIFIWIKANSGYSSLSAHVDFGQVGNPFATFDPTKGFQALFTRMNFGAAQTYALSGRIVNA